MTDHIEIPTRMLVHALVREDGTVGADELYTVANTLGMSDQQVRLCVKRLVAEGRFTHEGRGRKAQLHATADTTRALAPNADFLRHAFQQDAGLAPWDGVWHLAAFAVPESARTTRDSLRETLVHLGGAPLQGGLYVCANTWEPYVEEAARRLGAHGALTLLTTTDLRRGDTREPAELARSLWPLQEIADRWASPRPPRPAPSRPAHRSCRTLPVRAPHHRGGAGRRTHPRHGTRPAAAARAPAPALARHPGPGDRRPVLGGPARTRTRRIPPGPLPPLRRHHPRSGGPDRALKKQRAPRASPPGAGAASAPARPGGLLRRNPPGSPSGRRPRSRPGRWPCASPHGPRRRLPGKGRTRRARHKPAEPLELLRRLEPDREAVVAGVVTATAPPKIASPPQ